MIELDTPQTVTPLQYDKYKEYEENLPYTELDEYFGTKAYRYRFIFPNGYGASVIKRYRFFWIS